MDPEGDAHSPRGTSRMGIEAMEYGLCRAVKLQMRYGICRAAKLVSGCVGLLGCSSPTLCTTSEVKKGVAAKEHGRISRWRALRVRCAAVTAAPRGTRLGWGGGRGGRKDVGLPHWSR
jgi:hypothetical protein